MNQPDLFDTPFNLAAEITQAPESPRAFAYIPVGIHDGATGTEYTARTPGECRDSVDRDAFMIAQEGECVRLGCVHAWPLTA